MAGFAKAVKTAAKLRMALSGPAGSGKTYTALALATALADGQPVAVVDTERGSASKYADAFDFDVMELEPPYHPDRYMAAIREAEAAGYAVLVIDSLSHAWNGQGGLLEVHEQVVKRQTTKNSYTAWAEVTPIQNRLVDAITGSKLHIIATMRAKTEYVQEQGANNRTSIRKVGTAPIQRDGMEFEFDIVGEMDQDNTLIVGKTRCSAITGQVIAKPGKPLAETLKAWLSGAPAPVPTQPAKAANWGGLRKRMKDCGVLTMAHADGLCRKAVGKDWEGVTDDDYAAVEAEVTRMEAAKATIEAKMQPAKVVDAANVDLADLPPVAMVP